MLRRVNEIAAGWRWAGTLVAALLVVALGLGAGIASAQAADTLPPGLTRANPLPNPGAFVIHGSNGYTIGVATAPADRGEPNRVYVQIVNSMGDVTYIAPARLDEDSIKADLGPFGKINMRWHPNGRVGVLPVRCKYGHFHIYVDEGTYRGSVHIVGENGFTTGTAHQVRGKTGWYHLGGCGYSTSEGFPGPGILLEASIFESRLPKDSYRYLSVVQNRPGERVSYFASMGEKRGRFAIGLHAYAFGRPRTLTVDNPLSTGTIRPPAPFSGTGTFERIARHRPGRWRGDLTVDFPGRPDVPLAGKNFGATLIHGFRETELDRLALPH
jgi:hypothetical protein